jgi:hypothetical protein
MDLIEGTFNIVGKYRWPWCTFFGFLLADGCGNWSNSTEECIHGRVFWLSTHLGGMGGTTSECSTAETFSHN